MVRNAAIVAGNSAAPTLVAPLTALLDDPDPAVRGAAVWALRRLDALDPNRITGETDETVLDEWRAALSTLDS